MNKKELIKHLDDYLNIADFSNVDSSKNWLQVDNCKDVIKKIWYSVDANNYIFDLAIEKWVDLIISHHWLFWWYESTITWIHYDRIKKLLDNNIALYSVHLPLDAHPTIWNNIWLIKLFTNYYDIQYYDLNEFWIYNWKNIWYWINFDKKVSLESIVNSFCKDYWLENVLFNFNWKDSISSICIVSWWGWTALDEAFEKRYDLFVTWEVPHYLITRAKELWQSVLLWWHRNTEYIWVKMLSEYLNKNYSIDIDFLNISY